MSDFDANAVLQAGLAHQNAGRFPEAQAAYQQVLDKNPKHPQALYRMGMLAHIGGRNDLAVNLLLAAWENDSSEKIYLGDWGVIALKYLGSAQVIAILHRLVERYPRNALPVERLASLHYLIGEQQKALDAYQRAAAIDPAMATAQANLGILLARKGDVDAALACSTRAVVLAPQDPFSHYSLGYVRLQQARLEEALASFGRALELDPAWAALHAHFVETLLRKGDATAALKAVRDAGGHVGYSTALVAFEYYALLATGEREAARTLLDWDHLVSSHSFPVPPGYDNLTALNQALAAEIGNHVSLMWEPLGGTTRGGRQTTNLLERPTPALQTFLGAVRRVLDDSIAGLPTVSGHPFVRHKPTSYGLNIWATVLDSGGYQAPHMHSSGWLSGVYYVQVPDIVATTKEKAGWLEFGSPPEGLAIAQRVPVYDLQPREGLVVLFPSYVFHRTVPFNDAKQRISIGFDVIP